MHTPLDRRLSRSLAASVVLAASALLVMPSAIAAPSWSGPSFSKVTANAKFSGRGFAANSAVSIAVIDPSGTEAHYGAVVSAKGTLAYRLRPTVTGTYQIKVLNSAGKVLRSAALNVTE
jgi:hypothetical protein